MTADSRDRPPFPAASAPDTANRADAVDTADPADRGDAEGAVGRLVDEQLGLAASRLPALAPGAVHPSPVDHDERTAAHATIEDVLLGKAPATPEMLEEMAALDAAPPLADEELARQALADGGADADPATPA